MKFAVRSPPLLIVMAPVLVVVSVLAPRTRVALLAMVTELPVVIAEVSVRVAASLPSPTASMPIVRLEVRFALPVPV